MPRKGPALSVPSRTANISILAQLNLIWVLLWHEFIPRRKRESTKLIWVFAEPVGQMAVLIILFSLIGRAPAYGRSFALFLLTGIVVLQFFRGGSEAVARGIEFANLPRRTPQIGLFHFGIAGLVFELLTAAVYAPVLGCIIWWWEGVSAIPHHPEILLGGVLALMGLSFGIGLIRGYCRRFLPFVDKIFSTMTRGLILVSGVFYMASWLPPEYRHVLSFNPLVHAIELVRLGVYFEYPTTIYSPTYLFGWILGSITFGMALVWSVRKRLRQ